jgi:hypothetical protein
MIKSGQKVKIYWHDAVLYKKPKSPLDIKPILKELEGVIVEDKYKDYITLKVNKSSKLVKGFDKGINFFSIPKGMIDKIENL